MKINKLKLFEDSIKKIPFLRDKMNSLAMNYTQKSKRARNLKSSSQKMYVNQISV
jgi:16S rRNA G527 N7-methylase RsmG